MLQDKWIEFKWFALGVVTSICLAVGALVARLPVDVMPSPAAILTWAATIVLGVMAWRTLGQRSLVGVILIYGFLGFGAAAAILYRPTTSDFNGPNVAVAQMAEQTHGYRYLLPFVVAAYAVWGAILCVEALLPLRGSRLPKLTRLDLSPKLLPFAAIPLLANVYGTGFKTLLSANHYLEHTGPTAAALLGKALGPIGVLICGYFVFRRSESSVTRVLALLIALAYEVVFLAQDTRFFAFWVPLMFAGGLLTGTWSPQKQRVALLVAAIVSILALQIPLGLRSLPNHGLVPSVNYLRDRPDAVFGSHDPINNFLFGAPLTLFIANDIHSLPISDVVTSVSPMPSQFNNWAQIAPHLRLNIYTPYSALGELLNHGWPFFAIIMGCFGASFALTERLALRRPGVVGGLSRMVVLGAAALFIVESTEYNLRSVARLVYYVVAALLFTVVLMWFQPRKQTLATE
jgi:hypothetical protein